MDIMIVIWGIIDIIIFLFYLPPLRKLASIHSNGPMKRSIESTKSVGENIFSILMQIFLFLFIGLVIFTVICHISNDNIRKLLGWYEGRFLVVLLPILLNWIKNSKFAIRSYWNWGLAVLVVSFSVFEYVIDIEIMETYFWFRILLNILITSVITILLLVFINIFKNNQKYGNKKISQRGIREDLYFRTPRLKVNLPIIELIKNCEKYFNEYNRCYTQVKGINMIEYVNLAGIYREFWYHKAAFFMKIYIIISIVFVGVRFIVDMSNKLYILIGLIFLFGFIVMKLKKVGKECLYNLGIRYFLSEWGYCMFSGNNSKFVGNIQMLELSRFHKYVHSFLDIAALCRAVAINDEIRKTNNICIISRNLSDLFINYTNFEQEKSWITIIPLWIAALFEFRVTGKIGIEVKATLLKSLNEQQNANLSIFLQSFWVDMERKKLEDGPLNFICQFKIALVV